MKKIKIAPLVLAAGLTFASIIVMSLLISPVPTQNAAETILSTEATRDIPKEQTSLKIDAEACTANELKTEAETHIYSEMPQTVEAENKTLSCDLPHISTHVKFFIDYRSYNLPYTPHYRLQQAAWTDKNGLRRFNNDYIVALGSFYSTSIGDRFKIVLSSGNTFTVILGDGKWDGDCDSMCMYMPCTDYSGKKVGNLMEFVIDEETISPAVYEYGSIEVIEGFEGDIVQMEYLGRDMSQDWDTYYE